MSVTRAKATRDFEEIEGVFRECRTMMASLAFSRDAPLQIAASYY